MTRRVEESPVYFKFFFNFELFLFKAELVAGFRTPKHNALTSMMNFFFIDKHNLNSTSNLFLETQILLNVDRLSDYSYLFEKKQV